MTAPPATTAADPTVAGAAPMPFIDLHAQQARLGDRIDKAIRRVLDHGQYIMGPEVARARSAARGLLRRPPRRHLRERHRRAAHGAARRGHRRRATPSSSRRSRSRRPPRSSRSSARRRCSSTSCPTPSTSTPPSLARRRCTSRRRAGLRPRARHRRRPVRPAGRLRRDRSRSAPSTGCCLIADAAQSFGATWLGRRAGSDRRRRVHQLLPGQAARLLRRRRCGLHRRRRPRRGAALAAGARPGQRQVRQRADRDQRPARHDPGRDPDREARRSSPTSSRPATRSRSATTPGSRVSSTTPVVRPGSTSAWAQYTIATDGRDERRGGAEGGGRADGRLLPRPAAPADRVRGRPQAAPTAWP